MSYLRIPSITLAIAAALAMIGCGQKEEPKAAAPAAAAPGIETVGRLLTELDLLFFNPSLFGTVETYTAINALKGQVLYYADLAARDPSAAARFLDKDLAAALAATAADLRATIDRMLD